MLFEANYVYPIYNQVNNHQKIFFNRQNYLFFLKKIHEYILPYADVLAWCLIPNHFHLLEFANRAEIDISEAFTQCIGFAHSSQSKDVTKINTKSLNDSIGILLRSYTRAINKQENSSGSIFRGATKAEGISKIIELECSFLDPVKGGKRIPCISEKEYLQTCFNYIHQNPVKAGLVMNIQYWEFSSFRDYCGHRNGKLVSLKRAQEFGLFEE